MPTPVLLNHARLDPEDAVTDRDERRAALGRLARSAGRRGIAIAVDLLGDRAEAEDCVQESLARACEQVDRLRDPGALEGWFYRVLTNLCLRTLRRRRIYLGVRRVFFGGRTVRGEGGSGESGSGEDGRAGVSVDVIDDGEPAELTLSRAVDARRLLRAVDALPLMQRTALILRYAHDLGVADIARCLDVSEGTVKTHLTRGLARLRVLMPSDKEP
jgi:RNA polymerase sigma-70 factor (ECF subfamily)